MAADPRSVEAAQCVFASFAIKVESVARLARTSTVLGAPPHGGEGDSASIRVSLSGRVEIVGEVDEEVLHIGVLESLQAFGVAVTMVLRLGA